MKNLFKALAAFQQEVPTIHKGTQGYGYSYAELSTILEKINPLLKKHGLGFTQPICGQSVKTIIFHAESGETIECATDIPQGVQLKGQNEFQVLGSAITYIRRYALSSALGLVTDKDTDASGEQQPKASQPKENKEDKQNTALRGDSNGLLVYEHGRACRQTGAQKILCLTKLKFSREKFSYPPPKLKIEVYLIVYENLYNLCCSCFIYTFYIFLVQESGSIIPIMSL
jgi:hypothetical protein